MRWASTLDRGPQPIGLQIGFVSIVVVHYVTLLTDAGAIHIAGFTTRPHEHLLHYWLLLVLGAAYVVWRVLLLHRCVDPAGEFGFALAAFGTMARFFCHVVLCGVGLCWGSSSALELNADDRLRFLIAAHRWGGLAAYILGLALVVWGSRLSGSATRAWMLRARARSGRVA